MKQTEVGLIPDDWEVERFDELFSISTETVPLADINQRCYVGTENMMQDKKGVAENTIELKYQNVREYRKDDILISNIRPYLKKIWFADKDGGCSTDVLVFRKIRNTDNANFLFKIVSDDRFFNIVNDNAVGTKMPRGDKNIIKQVLFAIPTDKEEQQRIAKALSDVDSLISTTEKLIQKKKNIKQGTMQNLLTGKKRLPGFGPQIKSLAYKQTELGLIPEDWEVKNLGEIFSIKHGYGFEGQFFSSENNQHIVVTPGNFKLEGGFQKQKQPIYYTGTYPDEFKLKPNDLIIMMTDLSKNSDTLGNPAIVPDDGNDYLHNQRIGLIQIHNDSFVKDYIYLLLCTKEYHEAVVATAAGSTVKHTSPKRIYSIKLVVSTSKEEQTAIANVLSSMDKEIETLNTKLEKYRNLKTAMMQQLLTGKIRLV